MLNLIPVVMFLLMQGAGGDGLSLRQQQALLDLAHRASAARPNFEIESALTDQAEVEGKTLAFWLQIFAPVETHVQDLPAVEGEPGISPEPCSGHPCEGWSDSDRARDGPSAL
jgi:hypothetical protein